METLEKYNVKVEEGNIYLSGTGIPNRDISNHNPNLPDSREQEKYQQNPKRGKVAPTKTQQ